VTVPLQPT